MSNYRDYYSFAEKLFEDSKAANFNNQRYIIGSILCSWISMESFINNMMNDFSVTPNNKLSLHEKAFLEEKQVRFITNGNNLGCFEISKTDEFKRIDDKILFLLAKFGNSKKVKKGDFFWQRFEKIKRKRNLLTHPKKNSNVEITIDDASEALYISKEIINILSKAIWNKKITL